MAKSTEWGCVSASILASAGSAIGLGAIWKFPWGGREWRRKFHHSLYHLHLHDRCYPGWLRPSRSAGPAVFACSGDEEDEWAVLRDRRFYWCDLLLYHPFLLFRGRRLVCVVPHRVALEQRKLERRGNAERRLRGTPRVGSVKNVFWQILLPHAHLRRRGAWR